MSTSTVPVRPAGELSLAEEVSALENRKIALLAELARIDKALSTIRYAVESRGSDVVAPPLAEASPPAEGDAAALPQVARRRWFAPDKVPQLLTEALSTGPLPAGTLAERLLAQQHLTHLMPSEIAKAKAAAYALVSSGVRRGLLVKDASGNYVLRKPVRKAMTRKGRKR